MPLLFNKFSVPKNLARKSASSSNNQGLNSADTQDDFSANIPSEIRLAPGDQSLVFENGLWIMESGSVAGTQRDNSKLKEKLQKLQEENNMLRIKLEVVMDILTQTTAESHLQAKEIKHLKNLLLESNKKKSKG